MAAGLLALGLAAAPVAPDTIRIVITYAPGGALDPIARILANRRGQRRTGVTIVVEKIGGAGGIVGLCAVA
jgi:tripartite-type tricarboxylate transporter receptor subunit TctC